MEYKVIKILNEKEIAIDYGRKDNARIGQEIIIYEEKGPEITYNNKNYGNLYKIKDHLEIVEIYEKFSICQKIIIEKINVLDTLTFNKNREYKKATALNVKKIDEKTTYKSYEPIKLGDHVQIID